MRFHYLSHVNVYLLWYLEDEKSVTGTNAFYKNKYLKFIQPVDNKTEYTRNSRYKMSIFPNKPVIGTGLHALYNYCIWIMHNEPGVVYLISEL